MALIIEGWRQKLEDGDLADEVAEAMSLSERNIKMNMNPQEDKCLVTIYPITLRVGLLPASDADLEGAEDGDMFVFEDDQMFRSGSRGCHFPVVADRVDVEVVDSG